MTTRRSKWASSVLGILAALSGASIWSGCGRHADPPAWPAIRAAVAERRAFEPWFVDLPRGTWSSPTEPRSSPSPEVAIAAARLEGEFLPQSSLDGRRRAAVAQLVVGRVAKGLAWLEQGVQLNPGAASVRCDLAGAYLMRLDDRGAKTDLARAIDSAQRGLDADPTVASCWFNLGVALERAHLTESARTAFEHAASLEGEPGKREAQRRATRVPPVHGREQLLAQLESPVVEGQWSVVFAHLPLDADVIEDLLDRRLLGRWATAVRDHDATASEQALRRAAELAEKLHDATGDRHAIELVASLQRCGDPCAIGWTHHLDALTAWDEERFASAREATAKADAALGVTPSIVNAARVPVRVTLARLNGETAQAATWLQTYVTYCSDRRFLTLTGRLLWQRGLIESEAGRFGPAVGLYREAADVLERAHDREGQAMVQSLLAYQYQQLADVDRAWSGEFEALQRLDASRQLRQRAILSASAALASATGLHSAALTFRAPLIEAARRSGADVLLARLLSEDATTLERLGRRDVADQRLRDAAAALEKVDDPGAASLVGALVQIARGRLLAGTSPREAADCFAGAIKTYATRGNFFAMPVLQLERGRALERLGDSEGALRAFTEGIDVAERERRTLESGSDRVSLLSARWDLYTALIDIRLRRKQHDEALALLDRARAGDLDRPTRQTTPTRIPLPGGAVALEYAVLPSGVHLWATADGRREHFSLPTSSTDLAALVDAFRTTIQNRGSKEQIAAAARHLFDVVCGPAAGRIAAATRLVIVPDGPLKGLPFGALIAPDAARPLIASLSIVVTPSLSYYAERDERPRAGHPMLAVGNPDRAAAADRSLSVLPGAEQEARTVAAIYPSSRLLTGSTATPGSFLREAANSSIVHFAGHAIVDDRRPDLSRLLLSASADDPVGAVFAADLSRARFANVRLIVLSACDTASGPVNRVEGVVGLARSFLSAGVASVIGTLWPVDDRKTQRLAVAVHQQLARGASAADALKHAQVAAIDNGADAADWAGLVVIGRDVVPITRELQRRSVRQ